MHCPGEKCKLCDRVFETDFSKASAIEHHHGRSGKAISSKFIPCLHAVCCVECLKTEKFMECPLCENQIKKVVYYGTVYYNSNSPGWKLQVLYTFSEWNSSVENSCSKLDLEFTWLLNWGASSWWSLSLYYPCGIWTEWPSVRCIPLYNIDVSTTVEVPPQFFIISLLCMASFSRNCAQLPYYQNRVPKC